MAILFKLSWKKMFALDMADFQATTQAIKHVLFCALYCEPSKNQINWDLL